MVFSLEVFPPKKDDEFEAVYEVLKQFSVLKPEFISVTYGAGGSNSKKTVDIASYIQNVLNVPALAHMTCVGNKKEDILKVCEELKKANISKVLALRGDRPRYMSDEQFANRDFANANDLISFLKDNTNFDIAAACYPEKHPESFSLEADLHYLKLKQDVGADFLITQMFFDNDDFYNFRDKAIRRGITLPIHTGIMPITNARQLGTTISLSGSSIPKALSDIIAKYGDSSEDMYKAGIDYCIKQILDLKQVGVDGIHIYSMNKPQITAQIVEAIGV
jgi:methylenetetrahydrofolate reductase (NADPH)